MGSGTNGSSGQGGIRDCSEVMPVINTGEPSPSEDWENAATKTSPVPSRFVRSYERRSTTFYRASPLPSSSPSSSSSSSSSFASERALRALWL